MAVLHLPFFASRPCPRSSAGRSFIRDHLATLSWARGPRRLAAAPSGRAYLAAAITHAVSSGQGVAERWWPAPAAPGGLSRPVYATPSIITLWHSYTALGLSPSDRQGILLAEKLGLHTSSLDL